MNAYVWNMEYIYKEVIHVYEIHIYLHMEYIIYRIHACTYIMYIHIYSLNKYSLNNEFILNV